MDDVEYIALSGGGSGGLFTLGVIQVLEKLDYMKQIRGMIGTSIGGLIAAMLVVGYDANGIIQHTEDVSLSKIMERFDPIRFFSRGFASNGKLFKQKLREMLEKIKCDPDITLSQLFEKSRILLILTTVCRETGKLVLLSHQTEPDIPLVKAIRMTTAIPYIFKPVKWKGKRFMDGGCRLGYPLNIFPMDKTLGIRYLIIYSA